MSYILYSGFNKSDCDQTFVKVNFDFGIHGYSEGHGCSFDGYQTDAEDAKAKANPVISHFSEHRMSWIGFVERYVYHYTIAPMDAFKKK